MAIQQVMMKDFIDLALRAEDGMIKLGDITYKGDKVLKIDGMEFVGKMSYEVIVEKGGGQLTYPLIPDAVIDVDVLDVSSGLSDDEILAMIKADKEKRLKLEADKANEIAIIEEIAVDGIKVETPSDEKSELVELEKIEEKESVLPPPEKILDDEEDLY